MSHILKIIENNLGNEDFTIQELCRRGRISRMHLHRKIKAWSGKSTSHYIRSRRLEKARDLLQAQRDLNISEIAYRVGFKDPNYFTRTFREMFGIPPSVFAETARKLTEKRKKGKNLVFRETMVVFQQVSPSLTSGIMNISSLNK